MGADNTMVVQAVPSLSVCVHLHVHMCGCRCYEHLWTHMSIIIPDILLASIFLMYFVHSSWFIFPHPPVLGTSLGCSEQEHAPLCP